MRDVLNQVSSYYKDNKESIQQKIVEITANRARAERQSESDDELSDQIFRDTLHSANDAYDPVFGGFGTEPKFPHTDAIDALLHAYLRFGDRDALHMARKTLDYMTRGGTYDQEWGGFYRYSTKRDWSIPHYEKMLEDNALLLRNLLKLYRITQDDEHRRYVDFTIEYVDKWLSDPRTGAFYGSQDADEEFYPRSSTERMKHQPPYVDKRVYASWNAMAISAYLEASWTRGRAELRERGLKAFDFLWDSLYTEDGGIHRYLGPRGPEIPGLLGEHAWTLLASLDAYEVGARPGDLQRSRALAEFMIERLLSETGAFFDTPEGSDTLGRLSLRQKPVKENAVAAEGLVRLSRVTHEARYEEIARRALSQYVDVTESQGYFVANYGKTVDMLLNPGADVKIVAAAGDGAGPLHLAALALPVPDRIVRIIDASDASALAAEALPGHPAPAAYACYGTLCSAPVTTPDDLFEMVDRTRQAYESSRPSEPLAGPRSERESD
jgi:uncharacterized protein YyaL (SSP411 family)